MSSEGLEEQIRLDTEAREREWAKPDPKPSVMERLQAHIDWCKQRL